MELSRTELNVLYIINFIFSIAILISLTLFFLFNNSKINKLLVIKNEELKEENIIRRQAEEQAKVALKERELLLAEIHHRVKNNLAIISALINLQIENLKDVESKIIFEETKDRIYSMALIHNQLYQNNSFAQIEFAQYINNFCSYLSKSYQTNPGIEIIEKTEKILLDIKTAIPCALILNELITNSFKHAFKNQAKGKIEVGLKTEGRQIIFYVSDSGEGMDKKQLQSTSMGMSLITSLIEQIDGKLEYKNESGSTFLISFTIANR
jgi:two-component sensor histidine kinase